MNKTNLSKTNYKNVHFILVGQLYYVPKIWRFINEICNILSLSTITIKQVTFNGIVLIPSRLMIYLCLEQNSVTASGDVLFAILIYNVIHPVRLD